MLGGSGAFRIGDLIPVAMAASTPTTGQTIREELGFSLCERRRFQVIRIEKDVLEFIKSEAVKQGIRRPIVLLMDCGCMLNTDSVEVDIKEEGGQGNLIRYLEKDGIAFYVSPKIREIADKGGLRVTTYANGKFRRLDFIPGQ